MIVALFLLPVSLLAISVSVAMFCSPFVVSYILCLVFQTSFESDDNKGSPTELQLVGLFLLPVASFLLTVATMMFNAGQLNYPKHRKTIGFALHANSEFEHVDWVDPRDMLDPAQKRRKCQYREDDPLSEAQYPRQTMLHEQSCHYYSTIIRQQSLFTVIGWLNEKIDAVLPDFGDEDFQVAGRRRMRF